jgi:acyl-CoA thioester hydrolase
MLHFFPVRIYYEDTDASGLVYHARYLHFLERGRTEMLREAGGAHSRLLAEEGLAFAVRALAIDYLRPARLDDLVEVETAVTGQSAARIEVRQRVMLAGVALADATLTLVCLDRAGRPRRLPGQLRSALAAFLISDGVEEANGKRN